jgi:hypothetical protein
MAKGSRDDDFSLSPEPASGNSGDAGGAKGNSDVLGSASGKPEAFVDPQSARDAASGSTETASDAPRKRGRPKGSINKTANITDLGAIQTTLLSIHIALVAVTKIQELSLEEKEAAMMATAIANVSRHYPTLSGVINGKIADHVALFTALTAVYGSRFIAYEARMRAERAKPINPNVVTMTPGFRNPNG